MQGSHLRQRRATAGVCDGGICHWNRLNGTLLSAQPAVRTVLLGGGLDGNPGILPEWIIAWNGQVIRDSPLLQTPADLFGKSGQFRQITGIGAARGKLAHDGMFRHGCHGRGAAETSTLQAGFQFQQRVIIGPVSIDHHQNGHCAVGADALQPFRRDGRDPAAKGGDGHDTDVLFVQRDLGKIHAGISQVNGADLPPEYLRKGSGSLFCASCGAE